MADAVRTPEATTLLPTKPELEALFLLKHGSLKTVGWAPRRRFRFGYFFPTDVYECLIGKLVVPGITWLDVGGGNAIFPENPRLAQELASRCAKVVAVDPSENVLQNKFVHESHRCLLEDYQTSEQFDLATMRMVVEHVSKPKEFVSALAKLVKPGGTAVVFTVNRRSPITALSWMIPFRLHHPIKKLFWGGEEEDTFPVQYLMNTRAELRTQFEQAGFEEFEFAQPDDLSMFYRFRWLNYCEFKVWSGFRRLGIRYPENCLLGAYRRRSNSGE